MKAKKLLFYLLAAILAGCVPVMSLHPLYNQEDVAFKEKLLGTWVDDPNNPKEIWEFKRIVDDSNSINPPEEAEKAYELVFCDAEGNKGLFAVHLVKLQDRLFLDVYPGELPWNPRDPNKLEWAYNTYFLVPAHTFIKIDSIEPQLRMRLTDDDEMEKLLDEDPNVVKHEFVDDKLILTASTKELQAFVLKYADDSRTFSNEIILSRKTTKGLQLSDEQDPNQH